MNAAISMKPRARGGSVGAACRGPLGSHRTPGAFGRRLRRGAKSKADHAFTARHAGCYALNVGEWKPSSQPGHGFMGIAPSRVRLDTVFGRDVVYADTARIFRWRRERDMPLIRPGWYGSAYWAPIDVSRMALRWTTGFHGVWMVLHRGDDRYRGRARAFTDVLIPGRRSPEASVVAEPIDCALVAYDSARLMPPRDTR